VIVSDSKRPVEHAEDIGVWRGEEALDIVGKQGQVEGLQRGCCPGLRTGQNRPAPAATLAPLTPAAPSPESAKFRGETWKRS
jgi:hypothetical protein